MKTCLKCGRLPTRKVWFDQLFMCAECADEYLFGDDDDGLEYECSSDVEVWR